MRYGFSSFVIGSFALFPFSASTEPEPDPSTHPVTDLGISPFSAADPGDRVTLAYRWAPIHHQDVDRRGRNALDGRSDFLARVDFDGDWDARNNWENLAFFTPEPAVYHSIVETSTHWFIVYTFFHPRDWANSWFETEHENDSEGVLFAIARDGSRYGALKAAVAVAHSDFLSFVPAGGTWHAHRESIDGRLDFAAHDGELHPVTAQEAGGHAMRATGESRHEAIVYRPSRTPPGSVPSANERRVPYALVDVFEPGGLWDRRHEPALFARFGTFAGDAEGGCGRFAVPCTENAANAPWGWNDSDDGPVERGDMARDPVRLVGHYFRIPEPLSRTYTHNPYARPSSPDGPELLIAAGE